MVTMAEPTYLRYVALGDSFTEGVGDPDVSRPNGVRGWADRVAEALAAADPSFGYANLAIRGRKLPQIIGEQVPAALALQPDLITMTGGGNDVLRPGVDVDALAASLDETVATMVATGATVVLFTLPDSKSNQAFKVLRGRTALFNLFVREIVDRHGAVLVDVWGNHDYDRHQFLDSDRLHLNANGHQSMAIQVLDTLGVPHALEQNPYTPRELTSREQRAEHVEWTRTFLLPWVGRRLTGRSSGDNISPKYPTPTPLG